MKAHLLGGPRDGKVIEFPGDQPPGQIRISTFAGALPGDLGDVLTEIDAYSIGAGFEVPETGTGLAVYSIAVVRDGRTWRPDFDRCGRVPYRWTGKIVPDDRKDS
ncbi:MAG TPA: hypothetical protein VIU37_09625 [Candidatus Limnocylindrales bacterium]